MTQRNIALARAFPILIGAILFGAIIVFLALRTMAGIEESEAVVARFEGLAGACEGEAVAQAAPFEAGEASPLTVAFRLSDGEWLYDPTAAPVERRAGRPQDAHLVLCLGPSDSLATVACGPDQDGVAPTRVYGEALTVRLVAARRGEVLAEEVLSSAPDLECRDEQGPVVRVSTEQLWEWVEEWR